MVQIRKAAEKDALGIAIVNVYTWRTTYTGLLPESVLDARIAALREMAARTGEDIVRSGNFIVAAADDTVVGFCMYGRSRDGDFKEAGEIFALYVLKGFQSMGIGRALFLAGINELIAGGMTSMIINCLQGNPALAFYRRMGGQPAGRRTDIIQGGTMTEDIIFYDDLRRIAEDHGPVPTVSLPKI